MERKAGNEKPYFVLKKIMLVDLLTFKEGTCIMSFPGLKQWISVG